MFSGLIQGLGEVISRQNSGGETRFRILAHFEHSEWTDGESIAVNGVCLSVEKHDHDTFTVYASRETLSRTTLAALMPGAKINLEQALAFGERLGGHLVSGHVDCVATVDSVRQAGESRIIRINFPSQYADQVIDRGSVTLDGISLTITSCGDNFLTINLIPDSQKRTNASGWQKGTRLNMETDLVGKYVARYLGLRLDKNFHGNSSGLTIDFLASKGFL